MLNYRVVRPAVLWRLGLIIAGCLALPEKADAQAPVIPGDDAAQAAEKELRSVTERILKQSEEARNELQKQATGTPTQDLQQGVITDLETLIELLKKTPPPQKNNDSSSNSSSSPDNSQQDAKNQSEKSKSSAKQRAGKEQNRQRPEDSEERDGASRDEKLNADRKRRLASDVWGHLPPALRDQLLNTYGERMLPQYEEFVRKFYEALSEPQRTRKR